MKEASNPIPAGRLQRAAPSQETYISKFRQVLSRHGLTMASIAIICLLLPSIQTALLSSLDNLFRNPLKYLHPLPTYFFVLILVFARDTLQ